MDRMDGDSINLLLETFREYARRGKQARLFLESRNGQQFGTLTVRIPGVTPGPTSPLGTHRRKSPSTVRRNQERLRNFLKKKASQDSLGSSTGTPSFCSTPTTCPTISSRNAQKPDMVTVETPVKDDLEESGEEQTKTDDANKDMEIKSQDVRVAMPVTTEPLNKGESIKEKNQS